MARLPGELRAFMAEGGNQEKASFLLEALAENLKSAGAQMNKRIAAILVCCIAFELITRSAVGSISVFGVGLNDLNFAQTVLPVLIGYLYFSYVGLFSATTLLTEAYDAIIEKMYPSLFGFNLEPYLRPVGDLPAIGLIRGVMSPTFRRLLGYSIPPMILVVFLGPPLFVLHAFQVLIAARGWLDAMTWLSAALSAFFVAQAWLLVLGPFTASKEWRTRSDHRA